MEPYDCLIKSVFIGNTGCGKSSIIERFINDAFDKVHLPTIGVEFFSRCFRIDNYTIKLHIWDLAGHTNFRNIISSYYRHAKIVFFVFDKTERRSFQDFEQWIHHFRERLNDIQIVIIANKSDLPYLDVTNEEAKALASKHNALFFEASAKDNININTIFDTTVKHIYNKIMNKEPGFDPSQFGSYLSYNNSLVKLDNTPPKKSSCC